MKEKMVSLPHLLQFWGNSKDLCFLLQSQYIKLPVFSGLQFFILYFCFSHPSSAAWHAFTLKTKHISILFQELQCIPMPLWRLVGWLLAPDCCYHRVTSTITQSQLHGAACLYRIWAPHWHCPPGTQPIWSDTCCWGWGGGDPGRLPVLSWAGCCL